MNLELPECYHSNPKDMVMLHSIGWLWHNYSAVFLRVPY